ncbi:MAG: DUF805 domain-containing protein [Bacteroidales bacterium]|nr:DUF805 domain-containing protein [Bacteroidales bacterium]
MGEYISIFKDTLLNKYVQFAGVASRKEFWTFFVITMIIGLITGVLGTIGSIINLLLFLPSLGVSIRRLRDAGFSPWWILISLTGIGVLVLLFMWAQKSK